VLLAFHGYVLSAFLLFLEFSFLVWMWSSTIYNAFFIVFMLYWVIFRACYDFVDVRGTHYSSNYYQLLKPINEAIDLTHPDSLQTDHVQMRRTQPINDQEPDLRPDALGLGKLKHSAKYLRVEVTCLHRFFPVLTKRMCVISLELLAQCLVGKNFDYDMTDEDMVKKLTYFMNSLHSVNFDRYRVLAGQNIQQDTKQVAFFYAKSMQQSNANLNCRMPGQNAEGLSYMDIEPMRLSCLILARWTRVLIFVHFAQLISAVGHRFLFPLVRTLKALLCHTLIHMIRILRLLALLSGLPPVCLTLITRFFVFLKNMFIARWRSISFHWLLTPIARLKRGWRTLRTPRPENDSLLSPMIELEDVSALPICVTVVTPSFITS
jgi:hypothetical protein